MNKTILKLIERASRNGEARVYSYTDYYGNPEHVEKYRVVATTVDKVEKWFLYHYDTLTATVTDGDGEVVYGQSRSDLDSIETFLTELTGYAPEMHYYPSKDVFTVVNCGMVLKEF